MDDWWASGLGDRVVMKGVGRALRSRRAATSSGHYKNPIRDLRKINREAVPWQEPCGDRSEGWSKECCQCRGSPHTPTSLVAGLASGKTDPSFPHEQNSEWREVGCPLGEQEFPTGRQRWAGGGGCC